MASESHRVRRVVFDLAFDDEPTAFAGRAQLERWCTGTLTDVLERALDDAVPDDRSVWVERIDIELGSIPLDQLDERKVADLVASELATLFRTLGSSALDGRPLESALPIFLRTGALPWPASTQGLDAVVRRAMMLPPGPTRALVREIREELLKPPAALRCAQQLDEPFLIWLERQLESGTPRSTPQPAMGTSGEPLGVEAWRTRLLDAAAESGPRHSHVTPPSPLRPSVLGGSTWADTHLASDAPPAVPSQSTRVDLDRVMGARSTAPDGSLSEPSPTRDPAGPSPTRDPLDPISSRRLSAGPALRDTMGHLVPNAGVVLLHPFLERFFSSLDLLEDRAFKSRACAARAIHLLHYLASGASHPSEPEVLVIKHLCGYGLGETLPRRVDLTDQETSEATHLLESALGHWGTLGRTSPDGLREGFLTRTGHLAVTQGPDRTWSLHLEARGIDVLLSSLPWSLSVVKLPWMDHPLWVEWS